MELITSYIMERRYRERNEAIVVTRDLDTSLTAGRLEANAWKKLACTKNRAENVHYLTRLSISSGKQPSSFAIAKWRRTVKRTSKVSPQLFAKAPSAELVHARET